MVFGQPNAICLPHIGASTEESEERCAVMGANQVVSWLNKGEFINGVNFPDIALHGQKGGQLTIIHKDQSGLIQRLSGYFGARGINIGSFQTVPGQTGYACTMIGPDEAFSLLVVDDLAKLEGVIRVIPLFS